MCPLGHRYPFLCSLSISSYLWATEGAFQFLKCQKLAYEFITWSHDKDSIKKFINFTNVLYGKQIEYFQFTLPNVQGLWVRHQLLKDFVLDPNSVFF